MLVVTITKEFSCSDGGYNNYWMSVPLVMYRGVYIRDL